MFRATGVQLAGLTLTLAACAAEAPDGPSVLALPSPGKSLAQFQREDGACRDHAQQQSRLQASSGTATSAALQRRYDVAYAQCMTASGDRIQPFAISYQYLYAYPGYYGPWLGPALTFGFFGPRHFRHHAFLHHGSGHRSHRR